MGARKKVGAVKKVARGERGPVKSVLERDLYQGARVRAALKLLNVDLNAFSDAYKRSGTGRGISEATEAEVAAYTAFMSSGNLSAFQLATKTDSASYAMKLGRIARSIAESKGREGRA